MTIKQVGEEKVYFHVTAHYHRKSGQELETGRRPDAEAIEGCCLLPVSVRVSLLCTDTMTKATLSRTALIGAGLQFRGLVHYHHRGTRQECRQAWCWRRRRQFYILICRRQEIVCHTRHILSI